MNKRKRSFDLTVIGVIVCYKGLSEHEAIPLFVVKLFS